MVVAAGLSVWVVRHRAERTTVALSRMVALVVLAGWIGEQVADVVDGIWSIEFTLPLQLTDVVTLTVAAVAAAVDLATGGNYMYLHHKPVHSSLLDVMARWPWYILETAALAIAMLLAVEALTALVRRRDVPQVRRAPARPSRP